jgi:hypothetical protein
MNTIPFAHAIHSNALDRACDSDKNWFEAHPERIFRVRAPMPYECNGPLEAANDGMSWWVLIAQIAPGFRLRMLVAVPSDSCPDEADDQELASMLMPLVPRGLRKLLKSKLRKAGNRQKNQI